MRRRLHTTQHLIKLMAHASRGETMAVGGAWGELKATALMTPQPAPLAGPLQPEFVEDVGASIGLNVTSAGHDHHLLYVAIELARAPIPVHWEPSLDDDEEEEEAGGGEGEDSKGEGEGGGGGGGGAKPLRRLQRYIHVHSGEISVGHPATPYVRRLAEGLRSRAERKTGSYKAKPVDSWVEFADAADSMPYFYNFATGERRRDFPLLEIGSITPCVMPPRKLEPQAVALAEAGMTCWGADVRADSLERSARESLWDLPARRARRAPRPLAVPARGPRAAGAGARPRREQVPGAHVARGESAAAAAPRVDALLGRGRARRPHQRRGRQRRVLLERGERPHAVGAPARVLPDRCREEAHTDARRRGAQGTRVWCAELVMARTRSTRIRRERPPGWT